MPLTLLFAILATVGITLLVSGIIGRRVGDEPRCPGCRHELSGLDAPSVCPECGQSLAGGVARGRRVRRNGTVIVGTLLIAASVVTVAGLIGRIQVLRWLPSAWLVHVHEPLSSGTHHTEVLRELIGRTTTGLSPSLATTLVDRILERQKREMETVAAGAAPNSWEPAAGDFVAAAFLAGLVDGDPLDRYLVQAVDCSIQFEPTIDAVELRPRVVVAKSRGMGTAPAGLDDSIEVKFDSLEVNGVMRHNSGILVMGAAGNGTGSIGPAFVDVPASVLERSVRVHATVRRGAHERAFDLSGSTSLDPNQPKVDRGAVATAFRESLHVEKSERIATGVRISISTGSPRIRVADPPALLIGDERRTPGTWSVQRRSDQQNDTWAFEWTLTETDLEKLGSELTLQFDTVDIADAGLAAAPGFRGRMTIPVVELQAEMPPAQAANPD